VELVSFSHLCFYLHQMKSWPREWCWRPVKGARDNVLSCLRVSFVYPAPSLTSDTELFKWSLNIQGRTNNTFFDLSLQGFHNKDARTVFLLPPHYCHNCWVGTQSTVWQNCSCCWHRSCWSSLSRFHWACCSSSPVLSPHLSWRLVMIPAPSESHFAWIGHVSHLAKISI